MKTLMRNKRIHILLLSLLAVLMLSGCGPQGKLYKKSHVIKVVKEEVPTEKYKLVSVEKVKDAPTTTELYTYQSKERDMTFNVLNTRRAVLSEANLYGKAVVVKYMEAIIQFYIDDILAAEATYPTPVERTNVYLQSFEDLEKAAKMLAQIDDVYKKELQYNTAEWLQENPLQEYYLQVQFVDENQKERKERVCRVPINATWDYDSLYDYVCHKYASAIKEGKIADDSVPADVMAKGHISDMKKIVIRGTDIVESAYNKAYEKHLVNNTESSYYGGYCYALSDYVIPLSVGTTTDEYAPKTTEEILETLGISYEVSYKKGSINWTYNGDKYEMKTTENSDRYIVDFKILKNGKDCNIPFVTYNSFTSPVNPTYMVGIRVADLAQLFGLSVSVDEENSTIYFE